MMNPKSRAMRSCRPGVEVGALFTPLRAFIAKSARKGAMSGA